MKGNMLLSLIHLDYGTGFFLSATGIDSLNYEHVMNQFRRSATISHDILSKAFKARVRISDFIRHIAL